MLEGVGIVLHVVVVVVGVGEEVVPRGEDVGRRDVGRGQAEAFGPFDFVDLARVVAQVLAHFVAEVGGGGAVADDAYGGGDADGAVVGGEDDGEAAFGGAAQQLEGGAVAEP